MDLGPTARVSSTAALSLAPPATPADRHGVGYATSAYSGAVTKGNAAIRIVQSQADETADVSLALETIALCKYPTRQARLRNRTQEADGSIPFISTSRKTAQSTTFLAPRLRRVDLSPASLRPSSGPLGHPLHRFARPVAPMLPEQERFRLPVGGEP
jgi:hypothetical protein